MRLALLDSYDGELASARAHALAALKKSGAKPRARDRHPPPARDGPSAARRARGKARAEAALRLAEAHAGADVIAQARSHTSRCLRVFLGRTSVSARRSTEGSKQARQVAGQRSIDDSPVAIRSLLQMYAGVC